MKKILLATCCFGAFASFAQNGFFVQPEIGGGMSNTCWEAGNFTGVQGQHSVLSYQGQVDVGYNAGKWRFSTGVGYLRTGVRLQPGSFATFYNYVVTPFTETNGTFVPYNAKITDYNPHLIIPVKVACGVKRFSDRLSFVPQIGAEYAFNQPRTFLYGNNVKETESSDAFKGACNTSSVIGLLQLNFEYRLSDHYNLVAGPSAQYMFKSELNFKTQDDYALLMNLGLKWNFKKQASLRSVR